MLLFMVSRDEKFKLTPIKYEDLFSRHEFQQGNTFVGWMMRMVIPYRMYRWAVVVLGMGMGQAVAQRFDTITPYRCRTLWAPVVIPSSEMIDSLMILPGSVEIMPRIDSSFYHLDLSTAQWSWRQRPPTDSVIICYVPLPIRNRPVRRYGKDAILNRLSDGIFQMDVSSLAPPPRPPSEVQLKGFIEREVAGGSQYPAVLRSNMSIELRGRLSEKWSVEAALSDNRMPLPMGGEAAVPLGEIQQAAVRIHGPHQSLTLGTLWQRNDSTAHFLRYNQLGQGIAIDGFTPHMQANTFYAFIPGIFHRMEFNAREGFGGPYLLQGKNGERPITLVSMSERVYLNGVLMKRGENADYQVDYLAGTVSFTNRHLLRSTDRITIEFRYTHRYYSRTHYGVSAQLTPHPKWQWYASFYGESDLRNRPRLFSLTPEMIERISVSNGSPTLISDGIDSTPSAGTVRYAIKDSMGYTIFYHSTHPDSARYHVTFSYVGPGNGDYIPLRLPTNQTVYRWVAPVAGTPQGEYRPGIIVEPPRRHQLLEVQGQWHPFQELTTTFGVAFSVLDSNTYTRRWPATQGGAAFIRSRWHHQTIFPINVRIEHQWQHAQFQPIERYRPVEFERQWVRASRPEDVLRWWNLPAEEHLSRLNVQMRPINHLSMEGAVGRIARNGYLESYQTILNPRWKDSSTVISFRMEWLKGQLPTDSTRFRVQAPSLQMEYRTGQTRLQIDIRHEKNQYRRRRILVAPSEARWKATPTFEWQSPQWVIKASLNAETYQTLYDSLLRHQWLTPSTTIRRTFPRGHWRIRMAQQYDLINPQYARPAIEAAFKVRRPQLGIHFLYQHQPRFQRFRTFRYLQVPAGRGTHTWNDYNNNGVAELDEFEPAPFPHLANYIRVQVPTDSFLNLREHRGHLRWNVSGHPSHRIRWKAELWTEGTSFTPGILPWWDIRQPDSLHAFRNWLRIKGRLRIRVPTMGWSFQVLHNISIQQVPYPYGFQWQRRDRSSSILRYVPPRSPQWEVVWEGHIRRHYRYQDFATLNSVQINKQGIKWGILRMLPPYWQMGIDGTWQTGLAEDTTQYPFTEWTAKLRVEYAIPDRMRISLQGMIQYIQSRPFASPQTEFLAFAGMAPGWNGEASLALEYPVRNNLQATMRIDYRQPSTSPPIIIGNIGLRYVF